MKVNVVSGSGLLFIGALTTACSANAATVTPTAGTYLAVGFVTSVQQTVGTLCFFSLNESFSFLITYNGADKAAQVTFLVPVTPTGLGLRGPGQSEFVTVPTTPKSGSTTWNGSYKVEVQPGNKTFPSEKFTGSLTPTSTLAFVGVMNFTNYPYFLGTNNCTVGVNYSAGFAGPAK